MKVIRQSDVVPLGWNQARTTAQRGAASAARDRQIPALLEAALRLLEETLSVRAGLQATFKPTPAVQRLLTLPGVGLTLAACSGSG
jgi:hypothetical protein